MADITYPETLLPCPFCGAHALQKPWHGGGPLKVLILCSAFNDDCVVGPSVTGETPEEAAERWNRRSEPVHPAAKPEPFPTFDGVAVWRRLSADSMELIGSTALELIAARHCERRMVEDGEHYPERRGQMMRAAAAAERLCDDLLRPSVLQSIDEALLNDETGFPRLPSVLGHVCRACGCSEMDACQPFSCFWVETDLCSACAQSQSEQQACSDG